MANKFLTPAECDQIVAAMKQAELNCSGEIRVHIDKHCKEDILDGAAHTFARLHMHRTKLRNGVLFYIAYADRKFAVIGDAGINSKVPEDFWNNVSQTVEEHFRKGEYTAGLCNGIKLCGEKPKEFFPYQSDDINELPDEISFG